MSKAMLQTGEAFTVEGYKNKHAGTHEAIISDDVLMLLREREMKWQRGIKKRPLPFPAVLQIVSVCERKPYRKEKWMELFL